jgi:hypothetical protein
MGTEIVRAMDVDTDQLRTVAGMLAQSGYFEMAQDANKAIAQMAVKVLAGREMGFGPFASVQGIHLIQGKPSVSANLMASAVKNSPRYDYRVRKMDATECTLEFFERDVAGKLESIGVSSFTAAEARTAGVKNMDKFPRNMLFARALSNGVRWYCPNVFAGNAVYIPEELGADVDSEGEVVTVQAHVPAPKPVVTPVTDAPVIDIATARKAFHAQGVSVFGKDWDNARHWLIGRFTRKMTPNNFRESTNELTAQELNTLRSALVERADFYLAEYGREFAERHEAAGEAAAAGMAGEEMNPNPFEMEAAAA